MQTKAWVENDRVRKQGSATIINAAMAAGIERVVQELVSMIYPYRGDAWIDEQCPPDTFPMAQGIWPQKQTQTASLAPVAQALYSGSAGSTVPRTVSSFSRWRAATSS